MAIEIEKIEIPDEESTFAVFSKAGYLKYLVSNTPGYDPETTETWFFDNHTLSFLPASSEGEEELSSMISTLVRVIPTKAQKFVNFYAYTAGVDSETMETYHIGQLDDMLEHKYDESSEFYPTSDEVEGE